ncbi:MAG: sigma-54-dependent Fis family transcriptional regulator [Deltaproteobacteria bacterium]|nr:sigma-54-dependent Fis family transcriptional regulator [Deltaproteobacteria bacterium]
MGYNCRILIVDDDKTLSRSLVDWFESENHHVCSVTSGEEAVVTIEQDSFDIIISDLKMPGIDGLEVLRHAKRAQPTAEVIIMTGYGTVETAVNAMKTGAYDYIVKPFAPEELDLIVKKIVEHQSLIRENIILREQLKERQSFESIVGKSNKMQDLFTLIVNIAPSNITVLVQGESGTGKEMIARAIHNSSPRKNDPFITVSCGALPETILESELFGHEKGAFTGAIARKEGRFEMARKGTLFLDEIVEMSQKSQVDLLRVLQEKELRRVGGTEVIKTDVSIIAATNKDLDREVEEGRFRQDLYYRLHVVHMHLPPLRERREDIPLLVKHSMEKNSKEYNREVTDVSPPAFNLLLQYNWPGNVRELEHVIEHAVLMTKGATIEKESLSEEMQRKLMAETGEVPLLEGSLNLKESVEQYEKQIIVKALHSANGVKKEAAKMLGISPRILSYYFKKYAME